MPIDRHLPFASLKDFGLAAWLRCADERCRLASETHNSRNGAMQKCALAGASLAVIALATQGLPIDPWSARLFTNSMVRAS